jgi:dTDP-4-dehydrorhamnose reductase
VRSADQIAQHFAALRPEFVVHLAAETDVDVCELRPDHAYATNALATKHIALACQRHDVPLAYVSTAGVFDGEKTDPHIEYDRPNPINVYGRSKLEGQRYIQMFSRRFYIVRAGWMVGGGAKDHKFVAKVVAQLRAGQRTIYAVGDKFGTPNVTDFARCFAQLIRTGSYGLYHMACLGRASRYDVAKKIVDLLGYAKHVQVEQVDSSFFREAYPSPRPRSEAMRNMLLDLLGLNTMRAWKQALEEYLSVAFPSADSG